MGRGDLIVNILGQITFKLRFDNGSHRPWRFGLNPCKQIHFLVHDSASMPGSCLLNSFYSNLVLDKLNYLSVLVVEGLIDVFYD